MSVRHPPKGWPMIGNIALQLRFSTAGIFSHIIKDASSLGFLGSWSSLMMGYLGMVAGRGSHRIK